VTGRYTGIYLRKTSAVPFRGGNQFHNFCSLNKRLPSHWVATKPDWQTNTSPRTVALEIDTRAKRIMDLFPILRAGAFVSFVGGAVGALPNASSPPSQYEPIRASFCDVRAVRVAGDAFHGLVGVLRPRLPRRGVSALVRTALTLRYFGGGSYVDICAAFGVHSATVYRALRDVVDAVNCSPGLALNLQLADCLRWQGDGARFQAQRNSPFNKAIGALDGAVIEQEQSLPADVTCVAEYPQRVLRSQRAGHL